MSTRGKQILLALLAPLILLGAGEGVLRLADLGYPTSFLVPREFNGRTVWVDNPFFGYRFFPPRMARLSAPLRLEKDKPADALRVVVLGESAALGDPQPEIGLPRFLELQLEARFPERRVEVINAAMTAINSHVIVEIARELAEFQPDAFVVYMGNNEVVGPFGPGTVLTEGQWSAWLTPARVALSRLRLTGVLRHLAGRATHPAEETAPAWSGMEMFRENQLAVDDPRLRTMAAGFERNLQRILAIAAKYEIKTVLCTMAVNLTDCAPFGSTNRTELTAEQRQAWQSLYREGRLAAQNGQTEAAWMAYTRAAALDDHHAELAYRLAHLHRLRGEAEPAARLFAQARDLDTQRFRTDARLNAIIRQVAAKHPASPLADVERAFGQGEDRTNFLDHVHFAMPGLHLACLTILDALETWYEHSPTPPYDHWLARLLRTPWSERKEAALMMARRERLPFALQWGNQEQMERLGQRIHAADTQIAGQDLDALAGTVRRLQEQDPEDLFLAQQWGHILCVEEKWDRAAPVLQAATDQLSGYADVHSLAALAQAMNGNPGQAADLLLRTGPPYGYYLSDAARLIMDTLQRSQRPRETAAFVQALLDGADRFPGRAQLLRPTPPSRPPPHEPAYP
jgi:tetratricopeptide (TPR) repeat protein